MILKLHFPAIVAALVPPLAFVAFACGADAPAPPAPSQRTEASAGVRNLELADLLERQWQWYLEENPLEATFMGNHRFDDRIADKSATHADDVRARGHRFLDESHALRARIGTSLDAGDTLTLDLFIDVLETQVATTDVCRPREWNVSAWDNPVNEWSYLPEDQPATTRDDAKRLLARWRQIPTSIDTDVENLRRGAQAGKFGNATSVKRALEAVDAQLAQSDEQWPLAKPKTDEHPDWTEAERQSFQGDLLATIGPIRAAITRWRDFVASEILPNARPDDRVGLNHIPDGPTCYTALIRTNTSLQPSADELHELGSAEIARINGEMSDLGEKLFGTRNLRNILERLRTDPELYFKTEDEIETKAKATLAAAKAKIPEFFGTLPKADCEVRRVPDYEAEHTYIGYYRAPNPDGSKPGEYFVNTWQPATHPRFEAEVLAHHDGIPGHHVQIGVALELPELPAFRKSLGPTSYIEGWGLYSERLADDMKLYSGDLDRMGMLSFDAWRASRLIVDTGMHAKGWSRERAVAFMLEHTALVENNVRNEVDRYIDDPAQALGYKVGQLNILRLREEARTKLGPRFDVKAFHDTVLGSGVVTMPILEKIVANWVASRR
ncbi:DUF885 domain-containing protein [Pendulispora rubella]|uniref:DUF885 domain-containing protein n=1 Tax=Pendulispora rubella TaxID=2741070 RepID=A0ABZ2L5D4_9BACT